MTNTATIMGRLTEDPRRNEYFKDDVMRYAISFTLAVAESKEKTSFIPCVYYGDNEDLSYNVEKGDRLIVTGRLSQRKYARMDGSQASVIEIVVQSFSYIEPKKQSEPTISENEVVEEAPF